MNEEIIDKCPISGRTHHCKGLSTKVCNTCLIFLEKEHTIKKKTCKYKKSCEYAYPKCELQVCKTREYLNQQEQKTIINDYMAMSKTGEKKDV